MFVDPYAAIHTLLSTGLSTLMAKTPIQITKQKPIIHIQAGTGEKNHPATMSFFFSH
jgi:hypothetical protein